jgi:4-aminobutyrate--pyruvate transaminase
MTGLPHVHANFDAPLSFVKGHATCPHKYRDGKPGETDAAFSARLAAELDQMLTQLDAKETVAAFIAEPMIGAGGVVLPPKVGAATRAARDAAHCARGACVAPPRVSSSMRVCVRACACACVHLRVRACSQGYFEAIAPVLAAHEVLMIADEVITGFGRTAEPWGCTTFNQRPHTLTCAKMLTSGYVPLSAVLVSEEIADVLVRSSLERNAVFGHGFTYTVGTLTDWSRSFSRSHAHTRTHTLTHTRTRPRACARSPHRATHSRRRWRSRRSTSWSATG